ncbi:hypothetical protein Vadar_031641 [Vaccinium darrowii]|uniref:Uncharacterized protein n=1 Tax=Vaccinium darrowii TaxID=229202 RepID=A0ACB7XLA3_9ERIC|nr:hypothetical protein Vadar_031641 [Vaccinium darrowii]
MTIEKAMEVADLKRVDRIRPTIEQRNRKRKMDMNVEPTKKRGRKSKLRSSEDEEPAVSPQLKDTTQTRDTQVMESKEMVAKPAKKRPTASERKRNMPVAPTKKEGKTRKGGNTEVEEPVVTCSSTLTQKQNPILTGMTEETVAKAAKKRPTASERKRNMPVAPTKKEGKTRKGGNAEGVEPVVTRSSTLTQKQNPILTGMTKVDIPVDHSAVEAGDRILHTKSQRKRDMELEQPTTRGKKSKVVRTEGQQEPGVARNSSLDTSLQIPVDLQVDPPLETSTQAHNQGGTYRRRRNPTQGYGQAERRSEGDAPIGPQGEEPLETQTHSRTPGRNHRRCSSPTVPSVEPDPPIGPNERSLLKSFDNHVAASIWKGEERGLLKLHCHSKIVKKWVVCERVKDRIRSSGLLPLCEGLTYMYSNRVLVSAFVERWHPETNSFHFQFGEMGITLDDVGQLTALPVTGMAVHVEENLSRDENLSLIQSTLGVSRVEAKEALQGGGIPFDWLRNGFNDVATETCPDWWVDCCARAYLLYVLGSTIFVDKTGGKVSVCYLGLLADLDKVGSYAFGAAALAYLYRQLGHASRSGVRQMSGYITLLEAWMLEHFPFLQQGRSDPHYMEEMPRARRWLPRKEVNTETTILYRQLLDDLLVDQVIFDPYKERRAVVPEIALYTGPIRCMGIVEPYLPDRVLRQFGFVQLVPGPPIGPKRGSKRGSVSAEYIVVYTWTDALWENWKYHVVPDDKRVVVKQGVPWESAPNYLDWFRTVSHVRVAPHRGVGQQGGGLAQRHEAALDLVQRALACATTSSNDHHRTLVQLEKILRGDMENDAQG